jgi:hypothetical protein
MKLAYAMLADAAEIGSSGKLSMVGGDFDSIPAPGFPVLHPRMTIVIKLLLRPEELERDHQLRVEILAPTGLNIAPSETQPITTSQALRPNSPKDDAKYYLVVTLPIIMFPMPGRYEVRMLVDDVLLGTLPLDLIEQPA